MAGKGAVLAVRIVSDASGAKKGMADTAKNVAGLEEATRKAGVATDAAGSKMVTAGGRAEKFRTGLDRASVGAAGLLAGLGALAKETFDAASELQQATGAVEAVFGKFAAGMKAGAADAAQEFGLSAAEFSNSAALIGSQLLNMGFSAEETVGRTEQLVGLGADLAAQYGGTTSDAVNALSSALKGERDPIERYAVSLSQAAIDAQVASMHLDTHTDAAKRNANAQATLALITKQAASAQGAFGREADTAAGQTQRASAEFENAKAALGDVLLPIVSAGAEKLAGLAGWMTKNKDRVIPLVAVIGSLAAGVLLVNAAVSVFGAISKVATALQWAWNIAMDANPIMLIVIGIAALVAGVILAYKKFSWFRDLIDSIGHFFGSVFDKFVDVLKWIGDKLSWIGDAASWVGDLASQFFGASGTVSLTPVAAGSAAGLFGSAGTAGYAPIYGASLSAGAAAGSGGGSGPRGGNVTVNVNVTDAIDPVATGRTLERILRQYAQATGSQVQLTVGRPR